MDNGTINYRRFCECGDECGLAEIIIEYRDGLIFYLNSIVGNISIAEELAEDTFVFLGTKKPHDKGISSFKTWLYTIGRNRALNYLRKHKKTTEIAIDDCKEIVSDEHNLEIAYIKEEQKITVHRALKALKPEYRQVLWLVYFEDLKISEAAIVLKKSVHNTETLVYRARKSLKSQLETEGFVYEKL